MVYSVTLAPIAWVYAAEVWSLETRAVGMGMATLSNWSFNFAIGFLIPPGFKNITWKLFMIFGTLSMAAAIQFFFTFPEVRLYRCNNIRHSLADIHIHSLNRLVARLLKKLSLSSCLGQ